MKHQVANSPVSFPVTLSGQWQPPKDGYVSQLPNGLADWLLDEGSLTARLKRHCEHFQVKVIGEMQQACSADDACHLITEGEPILVREVLLYCDNVPQVFARSILPLKSLTGKEEQLANLGEQPLGQVLFNNASLQRQRLELSSFSCQSTIALLANDLSKASQVSYDLDENNQQLWGRRSIFIIENKPLMVAEVFLPGSYAYQNDNSG